MVTCLPPDIIIIIIIIIIFYPTCCGSRYFVDEAALERVLANVRASCGRCSACWLCCAWAVLCYALAVHEP